MKAGVTIKSGFVRRWNVAEETSTVTATLQLREKPRSVSSWSALCYC